MQSTMVVMLLVIIGGVSANTVTEECRQQMLPETQFLSGLMLWSDYIYYRTPDGTLTTEQHTKCYECTHLRDGVYVVHPKSNLTTVDSMCLYQEDMDEDTPTIIMYHMIFEVGKCSSPFRYQYMSHHDMAFYDPEGDWKKQHSQEPIRMIIPFYMITWE